MINTVFEDDSIAVRPTVVEVNLDALRHNVDAVRTLAGTAQIMATVKANAYGHGLIRTSKELLAAGVQQLGVAFLEEGIALRKAGITAPILVLGGIIGNQISHFLEYDLQLTASSVFKLQQIGIVFLITAQMGTNAGQQFLNAKGLNDIIIGSSIKSGYSVAHFIFSGEENHRNLAAGRSESAANL